MKIELEKIINCNATLRKLSAIPIKASSAYKILKILDPIFKEIKSFEDIRIKKIKEYGTIKEDQSYEIKKEHIDKFQSEIKELLSFEIKLSDEKINLSMFEDSKISVDEIKGIEWLISK